MHSLLPHIAKMCLRKKLSIHGQHRLVLLYYTYLSTVFTCHDVVVQLVFLFVLSFMYTYGLKIFNYDLNVNKMFNWPHKMMVLFVKFTCGFGPPIFRLVSTFWGQHSCRFKQDCIRNLKSDRWNLHVAAKLNSNINTKFQSGDKFTGFYLSWFGRRCHYKLMNQMSCFTNDQQRCLSFLGSLCWNPVELRVCQHRRFTNTFRTSKT